MAAVGGVGWLFSSQRRLTLSSDDLFTSPYRSMLSDCLVAMWSQRFVALNWYKHFHTLSVQLPVLVTGALKTPSPPSIRRHGSRAMLVTRYEFFQERLGVLHWWRWKAYLFTGNNVFAFFFWMLSLNVTEGRKRLCRASTEGLKMSSTFGDHSSSVICRNAINTWIDADRNPSWKVCYGGAYVIVIGICEYVKISPRL